MPKPVLAVLQGERNQGAGSESEPVGKTSGLSAIPRSDHEPVSTEPQQCHRIARTEGAFDYRVDQGTAEQHLAGIMHHTSVTDPVLAPILVQEGNPKYETRPLHDESLAE